MAFDPNGNCFLHDSSTTKVASVGTVRSPRACGKFQMDKIKVRVTFIYGLNGNR